MLAGLGALLGDGRMGSYLTARGPGGYWFYRKGAAGIEFDDGERQEIVTVQEPYYLSGTPPVAILVDRDTASSGEAVAIAFRGRPRARHFGTATYGLCTSNQGFLLSDGANLVITVGLNVDRSGRHENQVIPDEEIPTPTSPDVEDTQLSRAIEWLLEQVEQR
jgi:C-terminal processing protease CtpA/Prc